MGETEIAGPLNPRFAEHVTSQAFALTMTGAMVNLLADVVTSADRGEPVRSNDRASQGLERRGLIVSSVAGRKVAGLTSASWFHLEPTMAGRLVFALTQQAGLFEGGVDDPLIAEMRRFQAVRAESERVANEEQERRHIEMLASIRLRKPEPAQ